MRPASNNTGILNNLNSYSKRSVFAWLRFLIYILDGGMVSVTVIEVGNKIVTLAQILDEAVYVSFRDKGKI